MKTMKTTLALLGVTMLALTALPTASAAVWRFDGRLCYLATDSANALNALEPIADDLASDLGVNDLPAPPALPGTDETAASGSCSGGGNTNCFQEPANCSVNEYIDFIQCRFLDSC